MHYNALGLILKNGRIPCVPRIRNIITLDASLHHIDGVHETPIRYACTDPSDQYTHIADILALTSRGRKSKERVLIGHKETTTAYEVTGHLYAKAPINRYNSIKTCRFCVCLPSCTPAIAMRVAPSSSMGSLSIIIKY